MGAATCRKEGQGKCQEAGKAWENEEGRGLRGRQGRRSEVEVEEAGLGREGNKYRKKVKKMQSFSQSANIYCAPTIYQAMCWEWKVLWWTRQIRGF